MSELYPILLRNRKDLIHVLVLAEKMRYVRLTRLGKSIVRSQEKEAK